MVLMWWVRLIAGVPCDAGDVTATRYTSNYSLRCEWPATLDLSVSTCYRGSAYLPLLLPANYNSTVEHHLANATDSRLLHMLCDAGWRHLI